MHWQCSSCLQTEQQECQPYFVVSTLQFFLQLKQSFILQVLQIKVVLELLLFHGNNVRIHNNHTTNKGNYQLQGFPGGATGKEPAYKCRKLKRRGFNPWVGKIPWRRAWNPLQQSCLENPMDRGAWQATILVLQRVRHDQSDLACPHAH